MLNDIDALATRVATILRAAIDECISERGRCSVALSRPTPAVVFERVNELELPEGRVDLFQVDERVADRGTDDRNLTLIERDLSSWVARAMFHPMPVDDTSNLEAAAETYAEQLGSVLDLVHLGLGQDGHTASLVPGDPVLDVTDRAVAVTNEARVFRRMTLTYPAINAARSVIVVVSGVEKADALRDVLAGDMSKPAARITAPNVRFYVDRDAASLL